MQDQKLRIDIIGDASKLNSALNTASSRLQAFGSTVSNVGKKLSTRLTLPLGLAGGVALKSAANFEKLKTQLNVLTGSAEKGAKAFERLVKFSAGTPFQLDELVKANNTLMGFGVSAEDAYNHLQMIGDIAAVSGGDLQGISVAFGQVAAAGRLMGQDLLQLINNGVPIIDMLSSSMGVAKSEIKELVSEGAVTFPVLIKAFQQATSEGGKFEGGMAQLSQTISGIASTVKDNLNIAFAELGNEIFKALNIKTLAQDFIKFIQNLTAKFKQLEPQTKKVIIIVTGLVAAAGPLLVVLGTMSSGIALVASGFATAIPILIKATSAFKTLTISMLANPVGAIAAAVVTLVAGFVEYLHRLEPAVSRTKTFFNLLKSLGNPLKFAALQAEDAAEALAEKKKEAEAAAKANAELKASLENLGKPLVTATKETENLGTALRNVKRVSAITLSVKTGDFDYATGEFAQGDIAVGAQQVQTAGIAGIEAPDGNAVGTALEGLLAMQNQANQTSDAIKKLNENQQNLNELANMVGGQLSGAFSELGNSMVASLGLGEGALGSFTASFLGAALDAVGAALSVSVANAIAGASAGSLLAGPIAPIVLPALIAGMVGLVKSQFASVPKFANGGIVSGPTMGLMGEYPGSKSNPEVIAPLDKLKGMIGQGGGQNVNVGGEFKINGQDLVVALQRADRNRSRIK